MAIIDAHKTILSSKAQQNYNLMPQFEMKLSKEQQRNYSMSCMDISSKSKKVQF